MRINGSKFFRLFNGNLILLSGDHQEILGYIRKGDVYMQQFPECEFRKHKTCGDCGNPNKIPYCEKDRPLDCVECKGVAYGLHEQGTNTRD